MPPKHVGEELREIIKKSEIAVLNISIEKNVKQTGQNMILLRLRKWQITWTI
jgi:hypothetical protein